MLKTIFKSIAILVNSLGARLERYFRARQVIKVLNLQHAQELAALPGEQWALARQRQVQEIMAVKNGSFDIIDRRSWAYPYIPESLHRLNQPILKNTPYNLRRFSETPIPRRAINLVRDGALSLEWNVEPTKEAMQKNGGKINPELQERIDIAKRCLDSPNNVDSWNTFSSAVLEDTIVGGYGTIEPRLTPNYLRPVKMWAVDGSTIRIYADWAESTPEKPHWAQLTGLKGERGIISFRDDELVYIRTNVRSSTPFGLGSLEVAFNCYSDDTEVLTKRGWKFWPDVKKSDWLATRSERGCFQWQHPTQLYTHGYKGEMVRFESQSTDFLVTPNHNMLGRKVYRADWRKKGDASILHGGIELLAAEKVSQLKAPFDGNTSAFQIPLRSKWKGQLPKWASSGKVSIKPIELGKAGPVASSFSVDIADWAAFLGLYTAEGSCAGVMGDVSKLNKHRPVFVQAMAASVETMKGEWWKKERRNYLVHIAQVKHSDRYAAIKELLERLPFGFKECANGFVVNCKALHNALFPLGNKYTKRVPDWVRDLPANLVNSFVHWACIGDGSFRAGGLRTYTTTSKNLADDMQEMFQKLGHSASLSCYKQREKVNIFARGRKSWLAPIYFVLEHKSEWDGIGKSRRVPYDGTVYCAEVPNHTLYVRRNGKAAWCGNSVNAFLGAQDMSARSASDQVHKTWMWWEQTQAVDFLQTVRRHIQNEIEGQGKTSLIAGFKKPEILDVKSVNPEDLLLEWQEFLIRIIGTAFNLSPQNFGLERDVNRNTSETMSETDFKSAVVPIAVLYREHINRDVLWKMLGWKDIQFSWIGLEDPDAETQSKIWLTYWQMYAICPDDVRKKLGMEPMLGGWGKLNLGQYTILQMAARSQGQQKPGGAQGQQPGGGAPGQQQMSPQDIQQLQQEYSPEEIKEMQQQGLVPNFASDEPDTSAPQEPQTGVLEQFADQITEFLEEYGNKEKKKKIGGKPVNVGALKKQQEQRFKKSEHEQTREEKMARNIEKRRQFAITNRPSNKKQGNQFTGRFR